MKNIFIEGIQGVGKSTLLNHIYREHPERKFCREGDYSPIDLAWCARMKKEAYEGILARYSPISEEIRRYTVIEGEYYVIPYTTILTDLPGFHKEMETYEVYNGRVSLKELKEILFTRYEAFKETGYVFESAFLQNILKELMLFYQLEDEAVVDFYRELYAKIDRNNFRLLYLYSDDIEETIKAVRKERMDDQGNEMWYPLMMEYFKHSPYGRSHGCDSWEDLIAYYSRRQKLEMRILEEVVGKQAVILPARTWKSEWIQ